MLPMNIKKNRHICNTMLPKLKIFDVTYERYRIEKIGYTNEKFRESS